MKYGGGFSYTVSVPQKLILVQGQSAPYLFYAVDHATLNTDRSMPLFVPGNVLRFYFSYVNSLVQFAMIPFLV